MSGLREVWPFVDAHHRAGRPVVLARLVGRDGPGARPIGAVMAVAGDGTWRGSLSGGCVEGIVIDHARAVLAGAPACLIPVSPGGELMPWEPAPACAGELRVLITPAPPSAVHTAITAALDTDEALDVGTALESPHDWRLSAAAGAFVERLRPRRRLVLVGATDLAATIADIAEGLDRRVVIVDPRAGHLGSGAFPASAVLVRSWPDEWLRHHPLEENDAVITLSHDPRIDDRTLRAALPGPARYVAALGSRATHRQRLARLDGTPGLARLRGPAGLDLGGAGIGETALSILAELVALDHGRTGQPLRAGHLPIRADPPACPSSDESLMPRLTVSTR
ncbi:XdhC/CoxI family protein [Actinoplanes italicus]|uniref:Xanthine dehydrogenase accessory factor n=1 Tax=Actinoplanes italicus TaxID=113567 RepID=A0A2T0JSG9_9ACTN|nr:XdhC family protein [Actinoplanes italicus]PRX10556.1 xanthine dehydrogenase accessory factor [Actinoplanes italicus]GIE36110.1 XdhC/CoxI family protein [Actinoplanes italicus]